MRQPFIRLALALLAGSALVACSSQKAAPHSDGHTVHWSYAGDTGPEHWGSLSPDYALCSTGTHQSPIDVAAPTPQDIPNIAFHYQPFALDIVNNGHTVQVNCAPGSYIELDNQRFDLVQFHFHAPSEHLIKGQHADAEMHLVHKSAEGRLAVVGVMLRKGDTNAFLEPIFKAIPKPEQKATYASVMVNPASLLPTDPRSYRYDGSLTTPPGTEGVKWCLMTEPVTLSAAQLKTFQHFYHHNNRPPQALNGRVVLQDTSK